MKKKKNQGLLEGRTVVQCNLLDPGLLSGTVAGWLPGAGRGRTAVGYPPHPQRQQPGSTDLGHGCEPGRVRKPCKVRVGSRPAEHML